jgi:hypothetical protein
LPSTVLALLQAGGLKLTGGVRWMQPIAASRPGVYLVSLCNKPDVNGGICKQGPIDLERVETWLGRVPGLQLDGGRTNAVKLQERLARFWLKDEAVIYIGKVTSLKSRIGAFYSTPLGNPAPMLAGTG